MPRRHARRGVTFAIDSNPRTTCYVLHDLLSLRYAEKSFAFMSLRMNSICQFREGRQRTLHPSVIFENRSMTSELATKAARRLLPAATPALLDAREKSSLQRA